MLIAPLLQHLRHVQDLVNRHTHAGVAEELIAVPDACSKVLGVRQEPLLEEGKVHARGIRAIKARGYVTTFQARFPLIGEHAPE